MTPITVCIGAELAWRDQRIGQLSELLAAWHDKTAWVQETVQSGDHGKHRADVLRERIEALRAQVAALAKALRETQTACDVSQCPYCCGWGPGYSESDRPAAYCHHEFSLMPWQALIEKADAAPQPEPHANCPAPVDDIEAAEREHMGCAHCKTGIYAENERLRAGLHQMLGWTDLEMGDGDAARKLASELLASPQPKPGPVVKSVDLWGIVESCVSEVAGGGNWLQITIDTNAKPASHLKSMLVDKVVILAARKADAQPTGNDYIEPKGY